SQHGTGNGSQQRTLSFQWIKRAPRGASAIANARQRRHQHEALGTLTRHAHANRVIDIFKAVSKGVFPGQHMHCCKALTLLAGWRTETNRHTFVTTVLLHRISAAAAAAAARRESALSGDVSCRNSSSRSN